MNENNRTGAPPLVSPDWLAERLHDPGIRIIEISSKSDDTVYQEGHIPGAVWKFWKEFCWHESMREFPDPEEMGRRLGRLGAGRETTIVLYGDPVQYGSYAYWVLTMAGHPDLRLLDGARTRWSGEGRPLSREAPNFDPVDYRSAEGDPSSRIGREDIRDNLDRPGRILLDVRSPEEYNGDRVMPPPHFDHGAERKGRIPGAVHLYYRRLMNEDDTFKSVEELRAIFAEVGIAPGMKEEVAVYCRLSHRATLAWIAMRSLLGLTNVRIYDGSWTEWGSIVGFPIEI